MTTNFSPGGSYVTSFQKKEAGSAGQRVQLDPLGGKSAIDLSAPAALRNDKLKPTKLKSPANKAVFEEYEGWKMKASRSQMGGGSFATSGKGLLSRAAPVQPVHGRIDWAAKYGSHR